MLRAEWSGSAVIQVAALSSWLQGKRVCCLRYYLDSTRHPQCQYLYTTITKSTTKTENIQNLLPSFLLKHTWCHIIHGGQHGTHEAADSGFHQHVSPILRKQVQSWGWHVNSTASNIHWAPGSAKPRWYIISITVCLCQTAGHDRQSSLAPRRCVVL